MKITERREAEDAASKGVAMPSGSGQEAAASQRSSEEATGHALDKMRAAAASIKDKLSLHSIRRTGALKSFNPTYVRLRYKLQRNSNSDGSDDYLAVLLRSRDWRKGRKSIAIPRSAPSDPAAYTGFETPVRYTSRLPEVCTGILCMFTTFPYWDMSFWVAFWFALGSGVWIANGVFAWLPVAYPDQGYEKVEPYGAGMTGVAGVILFQIGAALAYLEAVNGCFQGSAMKRLLEAYDNPELHKKELFDTRVREIFHDMIPPRPPKAERRWKSLQKASQLEAGWIVLDGRDRDAPIYPQTYAQIPRHGEGNDDLAREFMRFRWWPSKDNFKEYQMYEIGFAATTVQLIAATLFIVNGIVGIPDVLLPLNALKSSWQKNLAFWIPDIVASAGFIVASWLFMVETQEKWWKPAPKILGWHVGFWALVGSLGFE